MRRGLAHIAHAGAVSPGDQSTRGAGPAPRGPCRPGNPRGTRSSRGPQPDWPRPGRLPRPVAHVVWVSARRRIWLISAAASRRSALFGDPATMRSQARSRAASSGHRATATQLNQHSTRYRAGSRLYSSRARAVAAVQPASLTHPPAGRLPVGGGCTLCRRARSAVGNLRFPAAKSARAGPVPVAARLRPRGACGP